MAWKPDTNNPDHIVGGGPVPGAGSFPFRALNDKEEEDFREYARIEDPEPGKPWSIFHPVCREEWEKRGLKRPD